MEWQGDGLILSVRRHGETSAIIDVLTRERGRHSGLVRGGRSRTQRPVLQAGNLVHVVWRARLEDHLGLFTADPHRMIVAGIIDSMPRLAAVTTVTTLASLLPEREPHPRLYDASLLLPVPSLDRDKWRRTIDAIWDSGGRPRIPETLERIRDVSNVEAWMKDKGMLALSFRSPDGSAEIDLLVSESHRLGELKQRAVVFLISDFLDSLPTGALKAAAARHDLIVLEIFEPKDHEPPVTM